jgi:hypothetical protein
MFSRSKADQPHPLAVESSVAFRQADVAADPATKERLLREAQSLASQSALAGAYSYLQKAVGLIAVTLPFVLAIGNEIAGGRVQGSISAYYYTHLGNYFVGSLFALGVFFLSYNHRPLPKYQLDNYLSNVASAMAIGVALFPTASDAGDASGGAKVVAVMHLVFACALFILLAVFSLVLFTRTQDPAHMTAAKRKRNLVYRICGWVIVAAIALVVGAEIVKPSHSWHTLFWLESVAVLAFGVSWLVKGGFLGMLADR